jgi:hypothetical protein
MAAVSPPRLAVLALVAMGLVTIASCALDKVDLAGKQCPCALGWTCKIEADSCGQPSMPPDADLGCCIYSDGRLYCANTGDAPIYESAKLSSTIVNHLRTVYSWFDCWGTGDLHAGSNTTWYHTLGDDTPNWGWIPAVDLETPDAFDVDPSAFGLAQCGD